jgi:hypothetical protein
MRDVDFPHGITADIRGIARSRASEDRRNVAERVIDYSIHFKGGKFVDCSGHMHLCAFPV